MVQKPEGDEFARIHAVQEKKDAAFVRKQGYSVFEPHESVRKHVVQKPESDEFVRNHVVQKPEDDEFVWIHAVQNPEDDEYVRIHAVQNPNTLVSLRIHVVLEWGTHKSVCFSGIPKNTTLFLIHIYMMHLQVGIIYVRFMRI